MLRLTRCLPFKCTFKQAILSGRLFFSIISYHFFRFHLTLLTKTLSTDFNRPVFILKKGSVIVIFHKNKTGISKIHHLKNSKSETQYRKKKHSAVDFRTRVTFAQVYQNTQRELASGQSFGAQYFENVWTDFKTNFIILYLLKHLY